MSIIHSLRIPIRGFAFFSPEPETLRVPETGFCSKPDDEPEEYGWGVLVDEVARGSTAWELGLRAGDLITAVNKKDIATLKQMTVKMNNSKASPLLNIYRNGRNYLLSLED